MTEKQPEYKGIIIPTDITLRKYGLTVQTWKALVLWQGGACGACDKVPKTRRLVIDHEHVRGWKDMPPEKRVLHVRGLLCWTCNHYRLARGATVENLRGAADYLEWYERGDVKELVMSEPVNITLEVHNSKIGVSSVTR